MVASLVLGLALLMPALAKDNAVRDKQQAPPSAILAGTVFRDTGFALRGAQIVVTPSVPGKKKAEWKTVSDARGEFVLRLPPGPASYNISVRASGYRLLEKSVSYAADERIELSLICEPGTEDK